MIYSKDLKNKNSNNFRITENSNSEKTSSNSETYKSSKNSEKSKNSKKVNKYSENKENLNFGKNVEKIKNELYNNNKETLKMDFHNKKTELEFYEINLEKNNFFLKKIQKKLGNDLNMKKLQKLEKILDFKIQKNEIIKIELEKKEIKTENYSKDNLSKFLNENKKEFFKKKIQKDLKQKLEENLILKKNIKNLKNNENIKKNLELKQKFKKKIEEIENVKKEYNIIVEEIIEEMDKISDCKKFKEKFKKIFFLNLEKLFLLIFKNNILKKINLENQKKWDFFIEENLQKKEKIKKIKKNLEKNLKRNFEIIENFYKKLKNDILFCKEHIILFGNENQKKSSEKIFLEFSKNINTILNLMENEEKIFLYINNLEKNEKNIIWIKEEIQKKFDFDIFFEKNKFVFKNFFEIINKKKSFFIKKIEFFKNEFNEKIQNIDDSLILEISKTFFKHYNNNLFLKEKLLNQKIEENDFYSQINKLYINK